MAETNFIFTDLPQNRGFVATVPAGIQSKIMLLETLGTALHFPDYYGINWDAFEECVRDLSWLPEHEVTIRHIDLPMAGDYFSVKTYVAILKGAVEKWACESSHRLVVVFPSELQLKVESLIEQ